jgi:hypothetical protein
MSGIGGRPRAGMPRPAAFGPSLAIGLVFAVAVLGLGATVLGLVPHRVPTPTVDASDEPHDFTDLEPVLPAVVDGRAAEALSSFDGTDAADDESMYGGVYTVMSDELLSAGPDDLDRLEIAQEFLPGGTGQDWTSVTAYRVPDRTAAGWQATLDSLLAHRLDLQMWTFRRETIAGRSVLVGRDERGEDGDWICQSGDAVIEIMADDPSAAEPVLALLP